MRLRPDTRRFSNLSDKVGSCRTCGCRLVLLPRDRRRGYCFGCYDPFPTDEGGLETP